MPLGQLVKKINEENAPPDGWRPEDKVASLKLQASSGKQQASSLQDLDPTIDWNKFTKELTSK